MPTAAATLFAIGAIGCSSSQFYAEVDGGGEIVGRPTITWVKPDRFVYDGNQNRTFEFRRGNGEVIRPGSIETDGGSIPRILWSSEACSPWTYAPAYLVHDWLYEANRRGVPGGRDSAGRPLSYTRDQADWIMAEVIKAQMENSDRFETPKSPSHLRRIHWAVSRFGDSAWNDNPTPVAAGGGQRVLDGAIQNLPFSPVIDAIQNEFRPRPAKPDLKGKAYAPGVTNKTTDAAGAAGSGGAEFSAP